MSLTLAKIKPLNNIALIQVWLGPLPDYFELHQKTCLNQKIDFYIFTDHEVDQRFKAKNFKFVKITKEEIIERLEQRSGKIFELKSAYKATELKPAYSDLFKDYVSEYEFVGWYDIDTLFGDILAWVMPHFEDYDVVSFGEAESDYNRISGPLVIMRNTPMLRTLYANDFRFFDCMEQPEYAEYDERIIMKTYHSLGVPVKILYESSNMEQKSLKIRYDAIWTGGKVYVEGEEKLIYHFWRKNRTKFTVKGNTIIASQKIEYDDDFYYITYLTESYEPLLRTLIKSIERYSTRKCILYTVNYTSALVHELSDQFIIRRIDITGNDFLDGRGRSFNTITSKPIIHLESLKAFPGKKFVFIDTDIYMTVNMDSIAKYFDTLENYPLTNSHVHDIIYCIETGEHVNSLKVLGDEIGVEVKIFPRRKTNVMLYDDRSAWFFQEQMDIYNYHKGSTSPGIFKYHDEDTFNIILSKYNLPKSLPVIDIEEVFSIDITRMLNYSYSETNISEFAIVPKSDRDVYVFHGYKDPNQFKLVDANYSPTVLDNTDILVYHNGNDLVIEKNSYLRTKVMEPVIKIQVFNNDTLIFECDWNIFTTHFFYVWDFHMNADQKYTVNLAESKTGRLLYRKDLFTK